MYKNSKVTLGGIPKDLDERQTSETRPHITRAEFLRMVNESLNLRRDCYWAVVTPEVFAREFPAGPGKRPWTEKWKWKHTSKEALLLCLSARGEKKGKKIMPMDFAPFVPRILCNRKGEAFFGRHAQLVQAHRANEVSTHATVKNTDYQVRLAAEKKNELTAAAPAIAPKKSQKKAAKRRDDLSTVTGSVRSLSRGSASSSNGTTSEASTYDLSTAMEVTKVATDPAVPKAIALVVPSVSETIAPVAPSIEALLQYLRTGTNSPEPKPEPELYSTALSFADESDVPLAGAKRKRPGEAEDQAPGCAAVFFGGKEQDPEWDSLKQARLRAAANGKKFARLHSTQQNNDFDA